VPATVYSVCFIAESGLTGSAVYTVPTGQVAVVRDLDSYVSSLGSTTLRLVDLQTGGTWFVDAQLSPTGHWGSWRGRQVFTEGQQFEVNTDVAYDVRLGGYLLSSA
jgi:hypothetical protein